MSMQDSRTGRWKKMAKRRGIEAACFFCNQSPCECKKPPAKKAAVAKTKSTVEPVAVEAEPSIEVIPPAREVRRITAPPPAGLVISSAPTVAAPPPVIKKIERQMSDDDVLEVVAIQTLVKSGLVTVSANPHISSRAAMKLSPTERARAWRAML